LKEDSLLRFLLFANILLTLATFSTQLLLIHMMLPHSEVSSAVEFKYVIFTSNHDSIEFVDKIWINGAPDYNNRPFYFQPDSTVVVKAPEAVDTPWGTAKFAFWQKEEGLTFQGQIVSNSTLVVKAEGKQIWWANYILQP